MRLLRYLALLLLIVGAATMVDPALRMQVVQRARVYHYRFKSPTTITKANPSKSARRIVQKNLFGSNSCSATIIGKHALLTASHCEMAADTVEVDGAPVKIVQIIRDGNDHSIYLIKGMEFTDVSTFSSKLDVGEEVFLFGNPRGLIHLYRHGFYAGQQKPPGKPNWPDVLMFDLNIGPGDSGGAVFNANQEIVAVISVMFNPGDISLAACFPLNFSAEQLKTAREF
jgi:hypothetical protein